MKLIQFKKDIDREVGLKILNKGKTPILNRLEIHLGQLEGDWNLKTILNPKNIDNEFYISMLYQIIYPSKRSRGLSAFLYGEVVEGENSREIVQNVVRKIGSEKILTLPNYGKHMHKTSTINSNLTIYKKIDDIYSFDVSFGDNNILDVFPKFCSEVREELNIMIESEIKINYKDGK